jgi:succinate-semialdehyde dehydrogenase / glutarate-semialdehyde dehydrogenase
VNDLIGPVTSTGPPCCPRAPAQARIFREEIFGPVAPVTTFGDDDEGLEMANDTEFGLVAYAFTQNLTRAIRVAEGLHTGMVAINQGIVSNPAASFGGVKSLRAGA